MFKRLSLRNKVGLLLIKWGQKLSVSDDSIGTDSIEATVPVEDTWQESGGPPQHWLDMVQAHAPQLLNNNLDATIIRYKGADEKSASESLPLHDSVTSLLPAAVSPKADTSVSKKSSSLNGSHYSSPTEATLFRKDSSTEFASAVIGLQATDQLLVSDDVSTSFSETSASVSDSVQQNGQKPLSKHSGIVNRIVGHILGRFAVSEGAEIADGRLPLSSTEISTAGSSNGYSVQQQELKKPFSQHSGKANRIMNVSAVSDSTEIDSGHLPLSSMELPAAEQSGIVCPPQLTKKTTMAQMSPQASNNTGMQANPVNDPNLTAQIDTDNGYKTKKIGSISKPLFAKITERLLPSKYKQSSHKQPSHKQSSHKQAKYNQLKLKAGSAKIGPLKKQRPPINSHSIETQSTVHPKQRHVNQPKIDLGPLHDSPDRSDMGHKGEYAVIPGRVLSDRPSVNTTVLTGENISFDDHIDKNNISQYPLVQQPQVVCETKKKSPSGLKDVPLISASAPLIWPLFIDEKNTKEITEQSLHNAIEWPSLLCEQPRANSVQKGSHSIETHSTNAHGFEQQVSLEYAGELWNG